MSDEKDLETLRRELARHGDRTSSFLTSYPGFRTFATQGPATGAEPALVRYMETPGAWIAGTEPLAEHAERARAFAEFAAEATRAHGKRAIMMPVTDSLSRELVRQGYHRVPVGAEPIFELARIFNPALPDPINDHPTARSLLRRGAEVVELSPRELTPELRAELDAIKAAWLEARRTEPLGFLNQVDPWQGLEHKRLFVLRQQGKALAFLCAAPIPARRAYFFADYLRAPGTRPGTIEALFVEAMRLLHSDGVEEVRLGLCPLARIDAREGRLARALSWLYQRWTFPFSFKSIHDFKNKFGPTRWEPLFLVSRERPGLGLLVDLGRVHFPGGMTLAWLKDFTRRALRDPSKARDLPQSLAELVTRAPVTLGLTALLLTLHALKPWLSPPGFATADPTVAGWLIGPLFHNNHYHFGGDLLSFVLFGVALEALYGSRHAAAVAAAGLWLTNPIAWVLLDSPLRAYSLAEHARFLTEVDFGSSNAVYAAVGALAAWLRDPRLLIAPFAINGIFLCLSRESWLSVHHLIGLALGFALARSKERAMTSP